MAEIKTAVVERRVALRASACLLSLRMTQPQRLGFTGGQYIIVHTDGKTPEGKVLKRTYSIVSADSEQGRIELLVQPLPGGPGSSYMASCSEGATLRFSGPWGKKHLPQQPDKAWLIATDTGLTTALGLASGRAFAPFLQRSRLLFLQNEAQPLVTSGWLSERLPAQLQWDLVPLPPVGHGERLPVVQAELQRIPGAPCYALLAGDGLLLQGLQTQLRARGVPSADIAVEPFFNKAEVERERR